MGPTETRSHDEWLTEVKRRGGRLRRRRQLTMAVVGVLVLMVPVGALTTFLRDPDGDVSQLVAGPGTTTAPAGDVAPYAGIDAGAAGDTPSLPVELPTTTTVPPAPPGLVTAPADDPVVRKSPPPTAPSGSGIRAAQGALPTTTVPPAPTEPAPAPCTAAGFKLAVSTDKVTYGPKEWVRGLSTLENRSSGSCLWEYSWGIELKILDGAGRDVIADTRGSSTTSHMQFRDPGPPIVKPGGTAITYTFGWETCANPWPIVPTDPEACVPFPPGTYTMVAEWTGPESGPPVRTTFQLVA